MICERTTIFFFSVWFRVSSPVPRCWFFSCSSCDAVFFRWCCVPTFRWWKMIVVTGFGTFFVLVGSSFTSWKHLRVNFEWVVPPERRENALRVKEPVIRLTPLSSCHALDHNAHGQAFSTIMMLSPFSSDKANNEVRVDRLRDSSFSLR